ncbi:hypothetical protein [Terribacillus sp. DMT04]|nr:hypothetical protein [Terribacillus sp. DMT04]QXE02099.1 hypothetical protein KS242_02285 [Terribacillus sp. DMT04]
MSVNPFTKNLQHAGDLSDDERTEILSTLERYMDYLRDEMSKPNDLPTAK